MSTPTQKEILYDLTLQEDGTLVVTIKEEDINIYCKELIRLWANQNYKPIRKIIDALTDYTVRIKYIQFVIIYLDADWHPYKVINQYPSNSIDDFEDIFLDAKNAQSIKEYINQATEDSSDFIPGLIPNIINKNDLESDNSET